MLKRRNILSDKSQSYFLGFSCKYVKSDFGAHLGMVLLRRQGACVNTSATADTGASTMSCLTQTLCVEQASSRPVPRLEKYATFLPKHTNFFTILQESTESASGIGRTLHVHSAITFMVADFALSVFPVMLLPRRFVLGLRPTSSMSGTLDRTPLGNRTAAV